MNRILHRVAILGVVLILAIGIVSAQSELRPSPNAPSQCPCFTQADIWAIPTPYAWCALDADWSSAGHDTLTTNIVYIQGYSGAEVKVSEDDRSGMCSFVDWYDPLHTWVHIEDLKYRQAMACYDMIVTVMEANQASCTEYCEGDDCDHD